MREAVIASTARTGIGRAFKGALNNTKSPTLLGHVLRHAVERAGIDPARIEDVVAGTVLASGTAGMNLARNAVFAAVIVALAWLMAQPWPSNLMSSTPPSAANFTQTSISSPQVGLSPWTCTQPSPWSWP